MTRAGSLLALVCLLTSACSGSGEPTTSAPAATPSVSTAPDGILDFQGGIALVPGTYRNAGFNPSFTFTLGEGWDGGHDAEDEFFDVISGEATVGFAHPTFVGGDSEKRVEVEGLTTREVIRTIASNRSLRVRPLPPTSIAGQTAPRVELAPRREGVPIFGGATGDYAANPDHRYRIAALQVDGVTMLVVAIATGEPIADAFRKADTVISTIEI